MFAQGPKGPLQELEESAYLSNNLDRFEAMVMCPLLSTDQKTTGAFFIELPRLAETESMEGLILYTSIYHL